MGNLSDYIKQGQIFLKKEEWSKLLDLCATLLEIDKDNFYALCFKVAGELEIDFVNKTPEISYILDDEQIEFDLKTRLYESARKKYSNSSKNIIDSLNEMYSQRTNVNGVVVKLESYYDLRAKYFDTLCTHIDVVNDKYYADFANSAKTEKEKQILEKYNKWVSDVQLAQTELRRYNDYANKMIAFDAKAVPHQGNWKKFILALIASIILLLLTISSLILAILRVYKPEYSTTISINTLSIVTSVFLLLSSGLFLKQINMFRKYRFLAIIILAITFTVCCIGISTTFNSKSNFDTLWFIIVGIVYYFVTFISTLFILIVNVPRKKVKNKSNLYNYHADIDGLLNDSIYIKYAFDWTQKQKKSDSKKAQEKGT